MACSTEQLSIVHASPSLQERAMPPRQPRLASQNEAIRQASQRSWLG
jgi:hypothetical protein